MSSNPLFKGEKKTDLFLIDPYAITIIDDPEHPQYDPTLKHDVPSNLVESIRKLGIIEPVRVTTTVIPGKIVVNVGRKRVRAARVLKDEGLKILVPCLGIRADEQTLWANKIAENAVRSGPMSPMTMAREIARGIAFGEDEPDLAVTFGCPVQTIKMYRKFGELAPKLQKAAEAGQIAVSAAVQFAGKSIEEQEAGYARLLAEGKPTVERAREVTGKARSDLKRPKRKVVQAVLVRVENVKASDDTSQAFAAGAAWASGQMTREKALALCRPLIHAHIEAELFSDDEAK